jgi:methyl-accepting chemotaxis protein
MADQAQKTVPAVEKLVADQTARIEAAVEEMGKLQSKGVAQVNQFIEGYTRVAQEQIAFAEQIGGEWRKLVLAATRNAADLFAPKA